MVVLRFRFASFCLEAKRMAVFRFSLASFRFGAEIMAIFRFFFVLFSLRSIFVSLQISTFRIDAKQAFRFEAKMTAHPRATPTRSRSTPTALKV